MARDIANILGATISRNGYYEGPGDCPYKVTWVFGHLCCLKEPDDYTPLWKRWSLAALPMIPQKFGIKLIDQDSSKRQFDIIKELIAQADEVINCGDAGQEGELIQRWVMQKAGIKCPVKRLWISSLTDESIRAGFADLKPESDYQNLYLAGLSRAIGDWILGMNATRLYTLKYSTPGKVLSIGRVQTPTLSLVVQRHKEILNFKPEDSWELRTMYRDVTFVSTGPRFKTQELAEHAIDRIAQLPFTVTDVSDKKGKEAPPRLFDLTSLQVECNKKWGWSADETLQLIQSLYEKKVTTYPRVDTTYLTDDIYKKVPETLRKMTPYANLTARLLALPRLPKSKKVFDNSKVTDHHAIIPTGESPSVLAGKERQMYHLIAMRFIAAFYPDCEFNTTTVLGQAGKETFKVTGKVITRAGWRELYADQAEADNDKTMDADKILPPFTQGESGVHTPSWAKKTTQPPKYYTEGTLLRAMETAGRTVDDEELREAMKENGIGRPSTRAAIIETLFRRNYIYRDRKNIMAAPIGIKLIETINEELLKSAKLTGIWENKLRRIERGEFSAAEFVDELKNMISLIVLNVLSDRSCTKIASAPVSETSTDTKTAKAAAKPRAKRVTPKKKKIEDLGQIPCPICGSGHLIKGNTAYGCSRYREGCDLRLFFREYPSTLTPQELFDKIKTEKK